MEDVKNVEEVKVEAVGTEEVKVEAIDNTVEVKEPEIPINSPLRRLVAPHAKQSRPVTEADIDRVALEARILHSICYESFGLYHGAYAMHHSQIDDQDPLDFFVTSNYRIIINPTIVRHSGYTVDSKEGCVTYPGEKQATVQRWQKVDTEYITIMVDPENRDKFRLSSPVQEHFSGLEAKIFQHEFDHGKAKYVHEFEPKEVK